MEGQNQGMVQEQCMDLSMSIDELGERVGALALEHWRWISQLLFTMEVKTVPVTTAKYLYLTAFKQGWEHAKEEGGETTNRRES